VIISGTHSEYEKTQQELKGVAWIKKMSEITFLRKTFNEAADLYDEVRPGYQEEIIDTIVDLSGLPPGGKILEIGCGTGQITIPFAKRGFTILALEPGGELAVIASRKCQSFPHVNIVQMFFESWPVQKQSSDLVLSAQAFHWIAPGCGCSRAASALKQGGAIALVWYIDVSEHTDFWQKTQPLYDAYFPLAQSSEATLSLREKIDMLRDALCLCDSFTGLREICYKWDKTYSGDEYLKLLNTFSSHRTLPEPNKRDFFLAMEEVIQRAGGVVNRQYETLLLLAHKT
jgi:SAM-dependent methyltransferase